MRCIYKENAGYESLDWLRKTAFRMTHGWKEQEMFFPSDALFLCPQYRIFFMIQSNIRYFILAKNYRGGVYWA